MRGRVKEGEGRDDGRFVRWRRGGGGEGVGKEGGGTKEVRK